MSEKRERAKRGAVIMFRRATGNEGMGEKLDIEQVVDLIIDAAKEELRAELNGDRHPFDIRSCANQQWCVASDLFSGSVYLHRDGKWDSADLTAASHSGFYASRKEAQSALDAAIAAGNWPATGKV